MQYNGRAQGANIIKIPVDVQAPQMRPVRNESEQRAGMSHGALLDELRMHEIELQMQNEELLASRSALEASRDRYLGLYDHAPVGYLELDAVGAIGEANLTAAGLLGVPRERLLGRRFSHWLSPHDLDGWHRVFSLARKDHSRYDCELTLLKSDGTSVYVRLDCVKHVHDDLVVRATLTDLSERRLGEQKLTLAASVFTHAREGIMIADKAGLILDVNAAFTVITGYSPCEVIGKNPRFLSSGMTDPGFYEVMWRTLLQNRCWQGELLNQRRNGEVFVAGQTITAVVDESGLVQHYVSFFTDVTQLREHQRQLEYIAHYDALTHLPNRVLLAERMQQALAHIDSDGLGLAIAYLDLDGFKAVNDVYGHETGDQVLKIVARRMKHTLREGCTLSRLGGDEFVAVMVGLEQSGDAVPMFDRLLTAVAEPIHAGGICVDLSASIGVTYYPQKVEIGADQLLRQADQAMYQAKLQGKNRYHIFDAQHDLDLRGRNAMLERIEQALRDNEFVLYYQPKVNMRTGQMVGVEALIRWQHPVRGLMLPDAFLSLVEGNRLSESIGDWVIEQALTQIAIWQACGANISVSINVGARQLQQAEFVPGLVARLAAHPGVKPSLLMIEILETSALEDMDGVSHTIRACADLGVRFALDDFGTGYSSLTYLKKLPVAQLKIDQTFVQDMLDDPDDQSILQGILGLAAAFKREVIAEGVDTIGHGTRLLELGCELAQGFCIAQPMPADSLLGWLSSWQPDAAWSH